MDPSTYREEQGNCRRTAGIALPRPRECWHRVRTNVHTVIQRRGARNDEDAEVRQVEADGVGMRSGKVRHGLMLRTRDVSQGRESVHDVHLFPLRAARGHGRSVERDSTRIVDWICRVALVEVRQRLGPLHRTDRRLLAAPDVRSP